MLSNAVNSKENLKIKTFEIVSLLYCIFDINCPLTPEHDLSIFNKIFLVEAYPVAQLHNCTGYPGKPSSHFHAACFTD